MGRPWCGGGLRSSAWPPPVGHCSGQGVREHQGGNCKLATGPGIGYTGGWVRQALRNFLKAEEPTGDLPFPPSSCTSQAEPLTLQARGHPRGHLNPESAPESPFLKGGRCHFISGTVLQTLRYPHPGRERRRVVLELKTAGTRGRRAHSVGRGAAQAALV